MGIKAPRPLSVSIISWLLIVFGSLMVVGSLVNLAFFLPESTLVKGQIMYSANVYTLLGGGVNVACGISMLGGQNWGRLLFCVFAPLSYIIDGFILGFDLETIGQFSFYIIFFYFLNRKTSNEFFGASLFGRVPRKI